MQGQVPYAAYRGATYRPNKEVLRRYRTMGSVRVPAGCMNDTLPSDPSGRNSSTAAGEWWNGCESRWRDARRFMLYIMIALLPERWGVVAT